MTSNGIYGERVLNVPIGTIHDQTAALLNALGLISDNERVVDLDFEKLLKSTDNKDTVQIKVGYLKGGEVTNND